jgi:hypothetical protein
MSAAGYKPNDFAKVQTFLETTKEKAGKVTCNFSCSI